MFDTELDFDTEFEAFEYATNKGLLVNLNDEVAINPENGS
jgi:hypothetical protein